MGVCFLTKAENTPLGQNYWRPCINTTNLWMRISSNYWTGDLTGISKVEGDPGKCDFLCFEENRYSRIVMSIKYTIKTWHITGSLPSLWLSLMHKKDTSNLAFWAHLVPHHMQQKMTHSGRAWWGGTLEGKKVGEYADKAHFLLILWSFQ